jgi:hypothetical protein
LIFNPFCPRDINLQHPPKYNHPQTLASSSPQQALHIVIQSLVLEALELALGLALEVEAWVSAIKKMTNEWV